MTSTEELSSEDIQKKLNEFAERAPATVRGRRPTPEEIEEQKTFKTTVKDFLDSLPTGTGPSYKNFMRTVKEKNTNKSAPDNGNQEGGQQSNSENPRKEDHSRRKKKDEKLKARQTNAKQKNNDTPIDYLCVLDFEATCDNNGPPPYPQEIIEFPTLLVNAQTGKVEDTFHFYIKPDVHPTLSKFCTELTGITQNMVDLGISLNDALTFHQQWLDGHGLVNASVATDNAEDARKKFLYVTCGDWDLKTCLPNQLRYHKQDTPASFHSWINVKWAFEKLYHKKAFGMKNMLDSMNLRLEGRHHSGIDDCKNIARICAGLLDDGWYPQATTNTCLAGTANFWRTQKNRSWPDARNSYKQVYLIRHAQSKGQVAKDRHNASLKDCSLTEEGKRQATALRYALTLSQLDSIELVVSSPLTRAMQTSLLAFPDKNVLVNYNLAEVGTSIPENMGRDMDEVMKDLQDEMKNVTTATTNKIDHMTLKPSTWPNVPMSKPKLMRQALANLYKDRRETVFAIVCHYNVIRNVIMEQNSMIKPENATPIKCKLFPNGDLVLV